MNNNKLKYKDCYTDRYYYCESIKDDKLICSIPCNKNKLICCIDCSERAECNEPAVREDGIFLFICWKFWFKKNYEKVSS